MSRTILHSCAPCEGHTASCQKLRFSSRPFPGVELAREHVVTHPSSTSAAGTRPTANKWSAKQIFERYFVLSDRVALISKGLTVGLPLQPDLHSQKELQPADRNRCRFTRSAGRVRRGFLPRASRVPRRRPDSQGLPSRAARPWGNRRNCKATSGSWAGYSNKLTLRARNLPGSITVSISWTKEHRLPVRLVPSGPTPRSWPAPPTRRGEARGPAPGRPP